MKDLHPKSNIKNKVRNTSLPKTKALMPLFEVISNSIHAIEDAKKKNYLQNEGEITINLLRRGNEDTLSTMEQIDSYPIISFEIIDNGIGMDDENLNSFVESDTDHKFEIGGKGVGRFICIKAFSMMIVDSCFNNGNTKMVRKFEFKSTKEGYHNFDQYDAPEFRKIGTKITLYEYRDEYQKHVPRQLESIAREIITHFQLYFIRNAAPNIRVINQNNIEVNCQTHFNTYFKEEIKSTTFEINEYSFELYLTRSSKAQSHKIYYCAHNRAVKEDALVNRIVDLGKYPVTIETQNIYYQIYIVSQLFDETVNQERIGFDFPNGEDEEDEEDDVITLSQIRKKAINCIEVLLEDYLNDVREKKVTKYMPTVHDEMPQYRAVWHHKPEEIRRLPPNLTVDKLDIALYKIEADWKIEIKETRSELLEESKDIQNLEGYKERYKRFLTEFNELGKSDLARYVVHRKSVIELLENLLQLNNENKFSDEDIIHSIFFPIRSSTDEIPPDKQNLWLLDERLTYHSFLASDKRFDQIKQLQSQNQDRVDLLIYNDALAFSEEQLHPHQSFTIVEFKKPQRTDYQDNDPKKNPLDQVEKYIDELLNGKVKSRTGRTITVTVNTPFYVYIVCDITPSLENILKKREFLKTPDGLGYYKFKTAYYNAYIEVLPFEKVLFDAKKRNRILFERLGI
ncbi:ATP-binding protein [Flavihumibacter profundi]|uniref:ATP-binding protein n=1 Tax=Flavihumibacter profundi TaxID=2716883 RepID=UPI001CC4505B|nr:ATP-binding protein [Flavihumibacter profundi]MBZ5857759.1 ATP-binding protein [Flavihumibacter profundi]